MKLFFDTEFTGLHKNTTLISIGIISELGDCFYGICKDYDVTQVNDWIEDNVLNNLELSQDLIDCLGMVTIAKGTKEQVKNALLDWLDEISMGEPMDFELVSDVCHYDMTLFVDMFETAFDLPDCICPCCYDINPDIASYMRISMKDAFDYSREKLVKYLVEQSREEVYDVFNFLLDIPETCKHNAMYDAVVIYAIYQCLL